MWNLWYVPFSWHGSCFPWGILKLICFDLLWIGTKYAPRQTVISDLWLATSQIPSSPVIDVVISKDGEAISVSSTDFHCSFTLLSSIFWCLDPKEGQLMRMGREWDASGLQWHPFGSAWICYVVQGIRHTSLHSWPSHWSFLHRKELCFSSSLWDVTFSWHILTASPKSLSQCSMEICLTTSEFTI